MSEPQTGIALNARDSEPSAGNTESGPRVMALLRTLNMKGTPRSSGEDRARVEVLAALPHEFPPILVHYPSMRVLDGVHRVAAAKLRGDDCIAVTFFRGSEADAFVEAVRANAAHGLPLSMADRKAAANRIILTHPHWSDRAIADVAGISSKTVAELRSVGGEAARGGVRIGKDGRARPLSGADGRRIAVKIISEDPSLSLRQVARLAGISPETVRDVRNKLQRGEDPIADRRAARGSSRPPAPRRPEPVPGDWPASPPAAPEPPVPPSPSPIERAEGIRLLSADPELGRTEAGRALLRLLRSHSVRGSGWTRLSESVPPYWDDAIAALALECGKVWDEFAQRVEETA